jgi:uncharacterized protein YfaS (alpha-2-macroglobulin family)
MKLLLRLACAIAIAAPLTCQSENPYFSLTTTRTFGTSEQPFVNLAGVDVNAVQIRVYRINDPVKFYSELEDVHSFGETNPGQGRKRTWIERIHDWKRGLRREIRRSLRNQFTESPSAHFKSGEEAAGKPAPPASKETYFAQAPVLNQEQLVLSFIQPVSSAGRWNATPVPVPVKHKGVYLVEAVHGNLRAYTILDVTDIVMINKMGRTTLLSYLADRGTGEPVTGASISSLDRNSLPVSNQTDAGGMTTMQMPDHHPDGFRLLAVRGEDVAFNQVNTYYGGSSSRIWTGYIYTDRPVYRPGDAIHFRGILRRQQTVGYEIPASENVSVQVADPDGKTIYQKTLTTNSNGVIHDELVTEPSSALGNFYVQVHGDDSVMSGNFEVQEYKKPEYEVHVTPQKPRVLEGETVQALIDSRYYFGEPVAGAKVSYTIHRSHYWFPFWYEPGDEVDSDEGQNGVDENGPAGEEIAKGEGALDADGKLTISVATTVSEAHDDYTYRIEAGVTDKAGREISGTGWITATYGAFTVFAEPQSYVVTPGSATTIKVSARDYDNKPVTTSVHLELAGWNWRERKTTGAASSTDVTTADDGTAIATIRVPNDGSELRVLASANAGGRILRQMSYLWAPVANVEEWGSDNQRSLKLVADKKTYQKGDKARILVIAGKPEAAILVTLEGRDLLSHQLLRAKGGTAEFEYTVTADDEPGFFVSADFIQDGVLYQGQKRISVPPEDHKIDFTLSSDKPTYLPGQTAIYNIAATLPDGKPAAYTDLSLGVVDEAIYAIRPDSTPNILNFFYGREYDSVLTQTSLDYYFTGEAGTRRMRLAELRSTSKLAQLKPEQLVKPKIRKIFPDTAFWAADLITDGTGHATAQVPLPDSLTTWRATVRGVGPGERFGSQTAKVIVRKNLILRLAVPRFFVQGDEVVVSAIVHNYLQTAKQSKVTLRVEGAQILEGSPTQTVEIASRDEAKVDWRIKAAQAQQVKITSEALTNEESDALELTLPVHPPGIPLHEGNSGSIAGSGNQTVTITFPASAVSGSRSMSVRISASIAGSIFSALDYLTSFPYGCVEQTMSSFLPDIMVQKSIRELGLKAPIDEIALHDKIQAGLERLYSFEHPDGGWGWWETDETHSFMTAYVVAGLSEARADGVTVNAKAINQGASWLKKRLAAGDDLAPDLRAYMLYALAMAGQPDLDAVNQLYAQRSKLSSYGKALLGLTLEQPKDTRVKVLASDLENSATDDGSEASWPATRDEMLDFDADVTPESTAYVMKFLSHEDTSSPLLPRAALWLVNHRNEGYWWSSTKQTAMVIYGLIDYLKSTNELHPDLSAIVTVNGRTVEEHNFNSDDILATPEVTLPESALQAASNQVTVQSNGKGRLYYSVTATHYSDEARLEKNGAISLNLLRDYFRLVPTKTGEKIVYDLETLHGAVSQGAIIAVRLTATGSDWRYLLLEDPIPAGTEFIENDNLYEINNKPPWWQYWFSRRELHDDHIAIFDTFFYEQQKQYFYLLKVVNPGTFHVSPARVAPMYQPGHLATTEARTLEVTK